MAWVTKNSEETYAPAPPPREYTKQEKAANWWHYHKVGVLVVIVLVVLLSWVLHDGIVTSVLVGASRPQQVLDNVKAIENLEFTEDELKKIEEVL